MTNNGTITGGTFDEQVTNGGEGTITGGTFNGEAVNEGTIRGGVFYGTVKNQAPYSLIQGYGETTPTLNGEIVNELDFGSGTPRILQPCNFGPNASVTVNNGVIEVKVIVDEVEKTVSYGADILKALGPSPTGLWYRENEDDTRSLVKEGETFASLQGETYTSSPLLPKPEIEIDYINETFSVTLAEEDVPEGVDVTDIYVNFRQPGQSEFLYAGMASIPIVLSLSDFDRHWGLKLPSDKAIPMEAYYSFVITTDDGSVNRVYGESVEWVIPARPYINVNTVQPGYNEMTVTLDAEPYEVYLEAVDGSTVIYDADDGAVDGCIHGLTEGTEYTVYFRVPPTEDSFGSFPYSLAATHTTLTRTHLSVNAAAGVVGVAAGLQPERGGLLRGAGHLAGRDGCAGKGQICPHRCEGRPGGSFPAHRAGNLYHHRQPFGGRGGRLCAGQYQLHRCHRREAARDRQPGHHRAAHSGADVHGRAHLSGGVRVAWRNPACDGRGLYRQLPEQREGGRGDDCHHRHGRLRGHAAGVLRYRAAARRRRKKKSRRAAVAAARAMAAKPPKPPAKRSKTGWWWMKMARPCPIRTPPWKNWRKPPARCSRARW